MDRLIGLLSSAITTYDWKWAAFFRVAIIPPALFIRSRTAVESFSLMGRVLRNEYSLIIRPVIGVNIMPFILRVFFLVWLRNMFGLFPYVPTPTSNIILIFRFTFTIWTTMLITWAFISVGLFLAHIVPAGAPRAMLFVLVAIELIRNLIRPITLAVRLSANMLAGHILIAVVNRYLSLSPGAILVASFAIFIVILEVCVALIQAYVITSLRVLFLRESYSCLKY